MDNVLNWDESKVSKWIAKIGFGSHEKQFKENGITGDVLVNLDHDALKDLSIHSLGHRMEILKNIYQLKAAYRIPLNEWDYVPPSALYENDWLGLNGMADYRKIEAAFQERDALCKRLTEDVSRLVNEVNRLKEEMAHVWKMSKDIKKGYPHSASTVPHKSGHLFTPPALSASHTGDYFNGPHTGHDEVKHAPTINDGGAIKVYGEKLSNSSKVEIETSKNVRLLLDDTCSKVILSALKKHNIMDDWQQYALWIQYGPHDNPQERMLSHDEKPLRISQKLKEAKQNPVFVLRHVKDNKPFNPAFVAPRSAPKPAHPPPHSSSHPSSHQTVHKDEPGRKASPHTIEKAKAVVTSGRVGYEVVTPIMSSSMSAPTSSSTPASSTSSATTAVSPPKRVGAQGKTPSDNYLDDLGLESGMANAIYTIMMDQTHDLK